LTATGTAPSGWETPVRGISISREAVTVTLDSGSADADFVVLAVPPPVWAAISTSPPIPREYVIGTGPGVKFLSEVRSRFWLAHRRSPTALDEVIGETWEATDNQAGAPGEAFDLSVFAGGTSAERALAEEDARAFYREHLEKLFPGYERSVGATRFVPWPSNDWIRCGYSCPAPGQMTTVAPLLARPFEGRLVFAGEHVNPCFFGYMEGALQSGLLALGHIAKLPVCSGTTRSPTPSMLPSQLAGRTTRTRIRYHGAVLESVTADDFRSHQGATFTLTPEDGDEVTMVLETVTEHEGASEHRHPFSVEFCSEPGPPLAQGTYRIELPSTGTLEVFLVPVGPGRLEAVFA